MLQNSDIGVGEGESATARGQADVEVLRCLDDSCTGERPLQLMPGPNRTACRCAGSPLRAAGYKPASRAIARSTAGRRTRAMSGSSRPRSAGRSATISSARCTREKCRAAVPTGTAGACVRRAIIQPGIASAVSARRRFGRVSAASARAMLRVRGHRPS